MYKQFTLTGLRLALAGTVVAALSACGTVSQVDDAGRTAKPVFPSMDSASMPEGYYVNLENLSKIAPGVSKKQVLELVGHPQFKEGMFGVREWDYILKFRQPNGQPDKVCQYKVLFDKDMVAQSMHYLPADCLEKPAQVQTPAAVQALSVSEPERISLSADASFGFGSSTLRPEGVAALDNVVAKLKQAQVSAIDIVGHTDRFGSEASNESLSLSRANAVRNYLVAHGVPGSIISVDGMGSTQPLVNCPGAKSAAVINCLAPNRRTTITFQTRH